MAGYLIIIALFILLLIALFSKHYFDRNLSLSSQILMDITNNNKILIRRFYLIISLIVIGHFVYLPFSITGIIEIILIIFTASKIPHNVFKNSKTKKTLICILAIFIYFFVKQVVILPIPITIPLSLLIWFFIPKNAFTDLSHKNRILLILVTITIIEILDSLYSGIYFIVLLISPIYFSLNEYGKTNRSNKKLSLYIFFSLITVPFLSGFSTGYFKEDFLLVHKENKDFLVIEKYSTEKVLVTPIKSTSNSQYIDPEYLILSINDKTDFTKVKVKNLWLHTNAVPIKDYLSSN